MLHAYLLNLATMDKYEYSTSSSKSHDSHRKSHREDTRDRKRREGDNDKSKSHEGRSKERSSSKESRTSLKDYENNQRHSLAESKRTSSPVNKATKSDPPVKTNDSPIMEPYQVIDIREMPQCKSIEKNSKDIKYNPPSKSTERDSKDSKSNNPSKLTDKDEDAKDSKNQQTLLNKKWKSAFSDQSQESETEDSSKSMLCDTKTENQDLESDKFSKLIPKIDLKTVKKEENAYLVEDMRSSDEERIRKKKLEQNESVNNLDPKIYAENKLHVKESEENTLIKKSDIKKKKETTPTSTSSSHASKSRRSSHHHESHRRSSDSSEKKCRRDRSEERGDYDSRHKSKGRRDYDKRYYDDKRYHNEKKYHRDSSEKKRYREESATSSKSNKSVLTPNSNQNSKLNSPVDTSDKMKLMRYQQNLLAQNINTLYVLNQHQASISGQSQQMNMNMLPSPTEFNANYQAYQNAYANFSLPPTEMSSVSSVPAISPNLPSKQTDPRSCKNVVVTNKSKISDADNSVSSGNVSTTSPKQSGLLQKIQSTTDDMTIEQMLLKMKKYQNKLSTDELLQLKNALDEKVGQTRKLKEQLKLRNSHNQQQRSNSIENLIPPPPSPILTNSNPSKDNRLTIEKDIKSPITRGNKSPQCSREIPWTKRPNPRNHIKPTTLTDKTQPKPPKSILMKDENIETKKKFNDRHVTSEGKSKLLKDGRKLSFKEYLRRKSGGGKQDEQLMEDEYMAFLMSIGDEDTQKIEVDSTITSRSDDNVKNTANDTPSLKKESKLLTQTVSSNTCLSKDIPDKTTQPVKKEQFPLSAVMATGAKTQNNNSKTESKEINFKNQNLIIQRGLPQLSKPIVESTSKSVDNKSVVTSAMPLSKTIQKDNVTPTRSIKDIDISSKPIKKDNQIASPNTESPKTKEKFAKKKAFSCGECGQSFLNFVDLEIHVNERHTNVETINKIDINPHNSIRVDRSKPVIRKAMLTTSANVKEPDKKHVSSLSKTANPDRIKVHYPKKDAKESELKSFLNKEPISNKATEKFKAKMMKAMYQNKQSNESKTDENKAEHVRQQSLKSKQIDFKSPDKLVKNIMDLSKPMITFMNVEKHTKDTQSNTGSPESKLKQKDVRTKEHTKSSDTKNDKKDSEKKNRNDSSPDYRSDKEQRKSHSKKDIKKRKAQLKLKKKKKHKKQTEREKSRYKEASSKTTSKKSKAKKTDDDDTDAEKSPVDNGIEDFIIDDGEEETEVEVTDPSNPLLDDLTPVVTGKRKSKLTQRKKAFMEALMARQTRRQKMKEFMLDGSDEVREKENRPIPKIKIVKSSNMIKAKEVIMKSKKVQRVLQSEKLTKIVPKPKNTITTDQLKDTNHKPVVITRKKRPFNFHQQIDSVFKVNQHRQNSESSKIATTTTVTDTTTTSKDTITDAKDNVNEHNNIKNTMLTEEQLESIFVRTHNTIGGKTPTLNTKENRSVDGSQKKEAIVIDPNSVIPLVSAGNNDSSDNNQQKDTPETTTRNSRNRSTIKTTQKPPEPHKVKLHIKMADFISEATAFITPESSTTTQAQDTDDESKQTTKATTRRGGKKRKGKQQQQQLSQQQQHQPKQNKQQEQQLHPPKRKRSKFYVYEYELLAQKQPHIFTDASQQAFQKDANNGKGRTRSGRKVMGFQSPVSDSDNELSLFSFPEDIEYVQDFDYQKEQKAEPEEIFLTPDDLLSSLFTLSDIGVDENARQEMQEAKEREITKEASQKLNNILEEVSNALKEHDLKNGYLSRHVEQHSEVIKTTLTTTSMTQSSGTTMTPSSGTTMTSSTMTLKRTEVSVEVEQLIEDMISTVDQNVHKSLPESCALTIEVDEQNNHVLFTPLASPDHDYAVYKQIDEDVQPDTRVVNEVIDVTEHSIKTEKQDLSTTQVGNLQEDAKNDLVSTECDPMEISNEKQDVTEKSVRETVKRLVDDVVIQRCIAATTGLAQEYTLLGTRDLTSPAGQKTLATPLPEETASTTQIKRDTILTEDDSKITSVAPTSSSTKIISIKEPTLVYTTLKPRLSTVPTTLDDTNEVIDRNNLEIPIDETDEVERCLKKLCERVAVKELQSCKDTLFNNNSADQVSPKISNVIPTQDKSPMKAPLTETRLQEIERKRERLDLMRQKNAEYLANNLKIKVERVDYPDVDVQVIDDQNDVVDEFLVDTSTLCPYNLKNGEDDLHYQPFLTILLKREKANGRQSEASPCLREFSAFNKEKRRSHQSKGMSVIDLRIKKDLQPPIAAADLKLHRQFRTSTVMQSLKYITSTLPPLKGLHNNLTSAVTSKTEDFSLNRMQPNTKSNSIVSSAQIPSDICNVSNNFHQSYEISKSGNTSSIIYQNSSSVCDSTLNNRPISHDINFRVMTLTSPQIFIKRYSCDKNIGEDIHSPSTGILDSVSKELEERDEECLTSTPSTIPCIYSTAINMTGINPVINTAVESPYTQEKSPVDTVTTSTLPTTVFTQLKQPATEKDIPILPSKKYSADTLALHSISSTTEEAIHTLPSIKSQIQTLAIPTRLSAISRNQRTVMDQFREQITNKNENNQNWILEEEEEELDRSHEFGIPLVDQRYAICTGPEKQNGVVTPEEKRKLLSEKRRSNVLVDSIEIPSKKTRVIEGEKSDIDNLCSNCNNCYKKSLPPQQQRSPGDRMVFKCIQCQNPNILKKCTCQQKPSTLTTNQQSYQKSSKGSKSKLIKCKQCNQTYSKRKSLLRHQLLIHRRNRNISHSCTKCIFCGQIFLRASYLQSHMRTYHSKKSTLHVH